MSGELHVYPVAASSSDGDLFGDGSDRLRLWYGGDAHPDLILVSTGGFVLGPIHVESFDAADDNRSWAFTIEDGRTIDVGRSKDCGCRGAAKKDTARRLDEYLATAYA